MTPLQRAFYEKDFRIAFLRTKATEFQSFFERLMGLAYRADFMPCRPWGSQGDRKNDGFLKSERRLFQVYAPNELDAKSAVRKISEDFEGARAFWRKHFDKWSFVHNAVNGLPPHVQSLLLDLEAANPGVRLDPWGFEELIIVFRRLDLPDCRAWFGEVPSTEASNAVGFPEVQVVLQKIATQNSPSPDQVRPVALGKIEANGLSDSVATLLKIGMTKAPLVERFLSKWHDVALGEKVADSFRRKYCTLRGQQTPDIIFEQILAWAAGSERNTPAIEVAALAVIAYYFDSCEIFEPPPGQTQ